MGISMRQWKMGGVFCVVFIGSALCYQNCSKVQVEDMPSVGNNDPLDVPQIPSEFSKATVGTSELADLKMLFVVDNSYTMKQNNINLASSFGTLFNSQNSDNLTLFPVTSYLLTVGQKTPGATSSDSTRLDSLLAWQAPLAGLTPSSLASLRQPAALGKLAGDSVGYSVQKSNGSYSFEPATVVGLDAQGAIVNSISKGKDESAAGMIQDFKNRMTLVQNVNIDNYYLNKDILDNESGLCAVARVLRSSNYVKAGDLAVLNLFSDENDADVEGKSCLAGYTYSEGNEDLINGGCETHRTTFNYKVNVPQAASCTIGYNKTLSWKLTYSGKQWSSNVKYSKISNYSCAETQLDYQVATTWKKKKTKVTVSFTTYKMLDGVKVNDSGVQTRDIWQDGYKTASECKTIATNGLSASSETYVSNTCVQSDEPVATCSFNDANCLAATQAARSVKVAGNLTVGSACSAELVSRDSASGIRGSEKCTLTGVQAISSTNKDSSCSANMTLVTSSNYNEDLSTQTACNNKALALGGTVNQTYPATCTAVQVDASLSKTGSLNLADFSSVSATGTCPADVKTKAIQDSGLSEASVTACDITAIPVSTVAQTLSSTCLQQATNLCAANSTYRNCFVKSSTDASTVQQAKAATVDEELACTAKCSDSKTGFCKANADLPTVDPNMTIADYLAQAQKSVTACAATIATTGTNNTFSAQKKADIANVCAAKNGAGLPLYVRVDLTYRTKGLVPQYVAGNKADANGNQIPAADLPTYIAQRANDLFGGQRPIVNVFVRTANDPLGDNGSRGIAYETLAATMNAQVYSVLSSDYSSALKDLSTVVKSKLLRTFKVPNMNPQRRVVGIILKSSAGTSTKLQPNQWVQSGASVEISSAVTLALGDELEFEYQ
jgi:hypothetical protein